MNTCGNFWHYFAKFCNEAKNGDVSKVRRCHTEFISASILNSHPFLDPESILPVGTQVWNDNYETAL